VFVDVSNNHYSSNGPNTVELSRASTLSTVSLLMSAFGFLLIPWIFSVCAVITGLIARSILKNNNVVGTPANRNALIGIIVGAGTLAWSIFMPVFCTFVTLIPAVLSGSSGF
jgi:hypothetical protein